MPLHVPRNWRQTHSWQTELHGAGVELERDLVPHPLLGSPLGLAWEEQEFIGDGVQWPRVCLPLRLHCNKEGMSCKVGAGVVM